MTKTEQAALQELGMDEAALAERTARAEALARGEAKKQTWPCGKCGLNDSNWIKSLRKGAEVELDSLGPNERVGYGTGKDDHMLYTHICNEKPHGLEVVEYQKPARKKRSDAGVPKPKPIAQKPGLLAPEQVSRLRDLIDTQETCRIELESAISGVEFRQGRLDAAQAELDAYLLELQGKG